jgi:tripartite-type tricarboxylate transporter receptor subunit TctC
MSFRSIAAAAALVIAAFPGTGHAQTAPVTQMKIMVGFPPGGSTDVLARVLAQETGKRLGREIIVINKPGASGAIAAAEVASSTPDGSTIGIGPSSTFTISHLFQGIKPDLLERTAALLQVGSQPIGMITKADSPFKSLKDVVAAARKEPGKVSVGIPGSGTMTDLVIRALAQAEKLELNIVPFRGDVPSATAVLGGHVQLAGISAGGFAQHVESGAVRLLVAMENTRSVVAPNVPTLKELGYDLAGNAIQYMYAPRALPAAERKRLADAFGAAIRTSVYIDIAKKNVLYSETSIVGEALDKYLLADRARNTALVARLGLGKKQ